MGILQQIGAAVGIGGVSLRIETETALHQGEEIAGRVHLTGGSVAQAVSGVTLALVRHWTVRDEHGNERTATNTALEVKVPVPGGSPAVQLPPGATVAVPFRLSLPLGVGLTGNGDWWKLLASARVAGALDPTATLDVNLLPPRVTLALREAAVRELGLQLHNTAQIGAPKGSVRLVLRPPPAQQASIGELRLNVLPRPGGLLVAAAMTGPRTGFLGRLKAVFGVGLRREEFQAPDVPAAVARLRALLG